MHMLLRLLKEEQGTTVLEIAMIVGIIAFAAVSAIVALGIKFMGLLAS
jgi:Flp pilus assembly pilin Flp